MRLMRTSIFSLIELFFFSSFYYYYYWLLVVTLVLFIVGLAICFFIILGVAAARC